MRLFLELWEEKLVFWQDLGKLGERYTYTKI